MEGSHEQYDASINRKHRIDPALQNVREAPRRSNSEGADDNAAAMDAVMQLAQATTTAHGGETQQDEDGNALLQSHLDSLHALVAEHAKNSSSSSSSGSEANAADAADAARAAKRTTGGGKKRKSSATNGDAYTDVGEGEEGAKNGGAQLSDQIRQVSALMAEQKAMLPDETLFGEEQQGKKAKVTPATILTDATGNGASSQGASEAPSEQDKNAPYNQYVWSNNPSLAKVFADPEYVKSGESAASGTAPDAADTTGDGQSNEGSKTGGEGEGDSSGLLLARNGRPLNASKRAAQNRAAQRAFRARRDEYVRLVEEKAKAFDELAGTAEANKRRMDEAARTIELLRSHNQSLRAAIDALGGRVPTPPSEGSSEQAEPATAEEAVVGEADAPQDEAEANLDGLRAVAAAAAASGQAV